MKTTVEIRDPLMAEAKAVCALHNITMKGLIERALAAEIESLLPNRSGNQLMSF
jgi:hypothetical protein